MLSSSRGWHAGQDNYQCLEQLANSYLHVLRLAEEKGATIKELRRLLFGSKSEKLRTVLGEVSAALRDTVRG